MDLVPGRHCDECSVCCITPLIDTPEFQKAPGVRCKHLCATGGCSIYATRFPACRGWHCGWRYFDFLGDDWRPDRSGVLLNLIRPDELPPGYQRGITVFIASRPSEGFHPSLYDLVARWIGAGILVGLAVNGPPGHMPAHTYLNEPLKEAASARNLARIEMAFSQALALPDSQPELFPPIAHFRDEHA